MIINLKSNVLQKEGKQMRCTKAVIFKENIKTQANITYIVGLVSTIYRKPMYLELIQARRR